MHTYGDLSDAQLLQTYGFVEDFEPGYDNPHNFVPVPTVLLLQSCSEAGDEVRCSSFDASGSDSVTRLNGALHLLSAAVSTPESVTVCP